MRFQFSQADEKNKDRIWDSVVAAAKQYQGAAELEANRYHGLLVHIYGEVKAVLEKQGKAKREACLGDLKKRLMTELRMEEASKVLFSGDFEVYGYFLRVRLTPLSDEALDIDLAGLWGADESEPEKRYQGLIAHLLNQLVPELNQGVYKSYKQITDSLEAFQALSRLKFANMSKTEGFVIRPLLYRWLLEMIRCFRDFIKSKVQINDGDYIEVCRWQRHLLHEFRLDNEEDYYQALENIQACYDVIAADEEKKLKTHGVMRYVKGLVAKISHESDIEHEMKVLEEDLKRVADWAGILTYGHLLVPHPNRAEAYIRVYQKTQTKLEALSQRAFKFRTDKEMHFRKESRLRYISLLDKLDSKLIAFQTSIDAALKGWREKVAASMGHEPDNFYQRANKAFDALESETILKLRYFDWVYHTAYCCVNTEYQFAHEMNARGSQRAQRRFERYDLEKMLTLSDKAVRDLSGIEKEMRKVHPQLHPDKTQDEEEKMIRDWCFKVADGKAKAAKKLAEQWLRSQWGEVAEEDLCEVQPFTEPPEANVLSVPERALDLSVLMLKQDYFRQIESMPTLMLKKRGDRAYVFHLFCKDPVDNEDSLLARRVLDAEKIQGAKDVWTYQESIKSIAESERRIEESERRIEESERRIEESEREIETIQRNLMIKELKSRFVGVAISGADWVNEQILASVAEIQQIFSQVGQDEMMAIAHRVIREEAAFASIRSLVLGGSPEMGSTASEGLGRYGTFQPPRAEGSHAPGQQASFSQGPFPYLNPIFL